MVTATILLASFLAVVVVGATLTACHDAVARWWAGDAEAGLGGERRRVTVRMGSRPRASRPGPIGSARRSPPPVAGWSRVRA